MCGGKSRKRAVLTGPDIVTGVFVLTVFLRNNPDLVARRLSTVEGLLPRQMGGFDPGGIGASAVRRAAEADVGTSVFGAFRSIEHPPQPRPSHFLTIRVRLEVRSARNAIVPARASTPLLRSR